MKKFLLFLITLISCFIIIHPQTAHAEVKINKTKATIYVGYSINLITGTKNMLCGNQAINRLLLYQTVK